MPPHCQLHGNMALLRDALLGTMLLHERFLPQDDNPITALARMQLRAQQRSTMEHQAKLLKAHMQPETIEKCRAIAAELFSIELAKQRAKQAHTFGTPKALRDRYTEEGARYVMKQTGEKLKGKSEWEI